MWLSVSEIAFYIETTKTRFSYVTTLSVLNFYYRTRYRNNVCKRQVGSLQSKSIALFELHTLQCLLHYFTISVVKPRKLLYL